MVLIVTIKYCRSPLLAASATVRTRICGTNTRVCPEYVPEYAAQQITYANDTFECALVCYIGRQQMKNTNSIVRTNPIEQQVVMSFHL